jgi:hypothetical protein
LTEKNEYWVIDVVTLFTLRLGASMSWTLAINEDKKRIGNLKKWPV